MCKKLFSIVAILLCLFSLVGCGKKSNNEDKTSSGNKETVESVKDNGDDLRDETEEEEVESEPLDYDWTGDYYLKNGTGELKISKSEKGKFQFSISGENEGDDNKIDPVEGTADIDEDFGLYTYEDGRKISFFYVEGTSIEVRVFDAEGKEIFVGAYLPQ